MIDTYHKIMSYHRTLPGNLFNEAKLLKCMGQLSLLIHDGVRTPSGLHLEDNDTDSGFLIEQSAHDASLYVSNLECFYHQRVIGLSCPYNSKEHYPLQFTCGDEQEGAVFDDNGDFSDEFLKALATLEVHEAMHAPPS